jgi:hypothetical protein
MNARTDMDDMAIAGPTMTPAVFPPKSDVNAPTVMVVPANPRMPVTSRMTAEIEAMTDAVMEMASRLESRSGAGRG